MFDAMIFALLLTPGPTTAQQLDGVTHAVDYPGMSADCMTALNTTVAGCPFFLSDAAIDNMRLAPQQSTELCTAQCQSSLVAVRDTISKSCSGPSDVIQYEGITWPATMIANRFLYTYDLSCRKDVASGVFCDEIFVSWLNQSVLSGAQNCSDCMLGVAQLQLASPFGYDAMFASDFASTTSSCAATGYSYVSPTSYALNATAVDPRLPTTAPTCDSPYQVKEGDTCESIAMSQRVPTFSIIRAGGLDRTCSNLRPGVSLCLPQPCEIYQVQDLDSCDLITSARPGLTGANIVDWNANIYPLCGNLPKLFGSHICISPPGGPQSSISASMTVTTAVPTTPAAKPTNAPPESNARCARWYTIQSGDNCADVSLKEEILLQDFLFLNPQIDSNCTNLLLGLAYCVRAVGSVSTYSGYPTTSQAYTLPPRQFNTTTWPNPPALPTRPPYTPLPTAPGTVANCKALVDYFPVVGITDQSQSLDPSIATDMINACDFVASGYDVDMEAFLSWNPSLQSVTPCALQPGYSYCAWDGSEVPVQNTTDNKCLVVEEIYPGTVASCSCFTIVAGRDKGYVNCEQVAEDGGITQAQLVEYNPWLASDCETNLFVDLTENAERSICIRTNDTAPTVTPTGSMPSTTPPTKTATAPTGPTQTGIVRDCTRFYTVVEGDTCANVYSRFGLTFEQFYAWNPAVDARCESLWLGYAYCVEGPTSTSTSAAATTTPAAPILPGTPTTCSTYYTVQSGDGCWSITQLYGIDLDTFYRWNPNAGTNCEGLWLGYGVCVAGGP
ncbi:hypothetical protein BDZ85DRAFT_301033 [Elsinoe ampelina]|uniref:LysM domain-containing protein n=1 Tax=Elsinoe ampelina TaxID=302913 RepID=A0A6A6GR77_9PEZI|nr:hypothetical protein BDZ85DRAFT_301033 [Elsinoe ampelina]